MLKTSEKNQPMPGRPSGPTGNCFIYGNGARPCAEIKHRISC